MSGTALAQTSGQNQIPGSGSTSSGTIGAGLERGGSGFSAGLSSQGRSSEGSLSQGPSQGALPPTTSVASVGTLPSLVPQNTMDVLRRPPPAGARIEKSKHALPSASVTFKDLSFEAHLPTGETKTILEPCSGHFDEGQLVAIMGPSGCGKTTLLDMLAGTKSAPYSGQVLVNGHERHPVLFRRISAYVGQEDCMPAHWKVREALEFNTALKRTPGSRSASRKAEGGLIDSLLEAFGLSGVADTYIGGPEVRGISGGQRRRVTLARGVAAKASLLFCDEPTSGLSATDAELCIKALRAIAKRLNVLVFVVIHQPRREVQDLFDHLVLLTSNPGRMAYCGTMVGAADHMKLCGHPVPANANKTDYYLDLLTPGAELDASDELVSFFQSKQKPLIEQQVQDAMVVKGQTAEEMLTYQWEQALEGPDGAKAARSKVRLGAYAVPFLSQLRTLYRRRVLLTLRNPAAVGQQLFMPAFMGVVLGAIFQGIGHKAFGMPQLEFIFILLTMLSLQSLPLMPLLIEERVYMKYETSEKLYKESVHILTTLMVTVPLSLLGAAVQILIIYAFSGLPYDYLPTIFGWTLLLFFMFDALFSCVAAAAPDAQQAQTMAVPFLVIFMLFNGMVVSRATSPVFLKWIFEISPTSYAMQAIVLMMGRDAGDTGKMVIASLGYVEGQNMRGIAIIVAMTLILRSLQILALKFLNNLQR